MTDERINELVNLATTMDDRETLEAGGVGEYLAVVRHDDGRNPYWELLGVKYTVPELLAQAMLEQSNTWEIRDEMTPEEAYNFYFGEDEDQG